MTERHTSIEYLPLPEVRRYSHPENAKAHDLDRIWESITRFGFITPFVLNELDQTLLEGHGRAEALTAARHRRAPTPPGVQEGLDGEWLVPVLRGVSLPLPEAARFRVAANQLVILGGWHDEALTDLLRSFEADGLGFDGVGFDDDDLDRLLAALPGVESAPDVSDEVPTLTDEPAVQLGDVYRLGEHRLVVGDASQPGTVETALAGRAADLVFTDPPYGVAYVGKTPAAMRITGDDLGPDATGALIAATFELVRPLLRAGAAFYVCAPAGDMEPVVRTATGTLGPVRQSIVWVKDAFVLGRSDYHWRHELVLYGWAKGGRHRWLGGRSEDSVWEFPRPRRSSEHPTMKPVALVRRALRNSSRVGDTVLDPFAGSGTTLIAAHQVHRRAALVELDPRYAQVIVDRWEALTGIPAVKE